MTKEDIELFYKLHPSLLQYVNYRSAILPDIESPEELRLSGLKNVNKVRTELWKRVDYINEFIRDNPYGLTKDELAIVASWKNALLGKFYILRHLKKFTIFITESEPTKAYGVSSLIKPLKEIIPYPPVYTEAVLIPFRDCIIFDGILYPYLITFGRGFRFDLDESYREAKSKFGIITTLNKDSHEN